MPIFDFSNGWEAFSETVASTFREGVDNFLKQHTNADLFIVTGRAGVGKSSYIKSITGEDVYVGSTLKSATRTTSLVPVVIEGKRCLFLDMPGFNTSDFDDWDIFHRLMTAMSVVQRYVKFRGVIYVDSMEESRTTPATEKILTWLLHFCGEAFMPNVTIVTTKWDGLNDDGIEAKRSCVAAWREQPLLRQFFAHGAQIYHHGLVEENGCYRGLSLKKQAERRQTLARLDVSARYREPSSLEMKVYTEIAAGATIDTTSAGRCLRGQHFGTSDSTQGGDTSSSESSASSSSGESQQRTSGMSIDDLKPWIKLLFRAANIYAKMASSSPGPQFEWASTFGGDGFPSDEFSDFYDDIDLNPPEATGPGICGIM